MASILGRLRHMLLATDREPAKPYKEQGVGGFVVTGGYVQTPERNADLTGPNRWHTAADLLSNISIIAASVRHTLNLISRPTWKAEPPDDTAEAKALAEFVEEVVNGVDTSWTRIVRRSAIYRYHGFNLQEWVAKKRDDGRIGIKSVEPRPAHTISKWDVDENGGILGVVQVSPQTGHEIYLPRQKLVYLVDDALTDRPDGLGWFRHLAEPAQRLRRYLDLETMGFERDLAGIPVGRAPIQRINQLITDGKLTKEQGDAMLKALEQFVSLKAKEPSTGLVLDSEPFRAKGETGETISSVMQWGLDLLTGNPSSVEALGNAIRRLNFDMALIMGTDSTLVGREGEGSRALSEDKSRNLYLTCNAALYDMAEAYDRDIVTTLWTLNGFPEELRPQLRTEDVSFQDANNIAKMLADMASAGAILSPDDPAIDDLRDLAGISRAPEPDMEMWRAMNGMGAAGGEEEGGRPSRENPDDGSEEDPPGGPSGGRGRAQKYDPAQPRDPKGSSTGGQWTSAGHGWREDADGLELQAELYAEARTFFEADPKAAVAIRRYQRQNIGSSREVNSALREGRAIDTEALDRAVTANDLKGMGLYRGASQIGDLQLPGTLEEARKLVGQDGTEQGFMSASVFPSNFVSGDNQMLYIRGARRGALVMAARDSKAIARSVGRERLNEGAEVLLPRGTRLRIARVSEGEHPTIPNKKLLIYEADSVDTAKRYNPDQPRHPRGSSDGGKWKPIGGASSGRRWVYRVVGADVSPEDAYRPQDRKGEDAREGGIYAFTDPKAAEQHRQLLGGKIVAAQIAEVEPEYIDDFSIELYPSGDAPVVANDGESGLYPKGQQIFIRDLSLIDDKSITPARVRIGKVFKYDPDQPRDPAGTPTGGQWTSTAGAALSTYSGDDPYANAIGINAKIRIGQQLTESEEQTLAGVKAAFDEVEPLAEPITVWRGSGDDIYGQETVVGHPLSTSRDIAVADEFSSATGGETPTVYRIEVPAGARVVDTTSQMPEGMRYQREMLLEPGGKLVPAGKPGQSNGVIYRPLRYIPPDTEG